MFPVLLSFILALLLGVVLSDTMPKLRYFDARGAAELARVLMRLGGMAFEDSRFPLKVRSEGGFDVAEFTAAKAAGEFKVNLDRVPVLELANGLKIGQSRAIERYVCSQCKLMGCDADEAALIDCLTENVRDVKDRWGKIRATGGFGPNEEKVRLTEKWFSGGELSEWLERLERSLPANASGQWHAVGDKVSYADVSIWHLLRDYFPPEHRNDVKAAEKKANCARLSKIADKVGELASLKAYLEQRPNTAF